MTKVAGEYYWAKTQSAGPSFCGRSGSGVLESGFQMDCLVYTYFFSTIYIIQFVLAPDHPERNQNGRRRVFVYRICIFCLKIKHRISLRIEPFWVITQRIVVIHCRRFGTTCRSHLRSSRVQKGFWILDSRRWDR